MQELSNDIINQKMFSSKRLYWQDSNWTIDIQGLFWFRTVA